MLLLVRPVSRHCLPPLDRFHSVTLFDSRPTPTVLSHSHDNTWARTRTHISLVTHILVRSVSRHQPLCPRSTDTVALFDPHSQCSHTEQSRQYVDTHIHIHAHLSRHAHLNPAQAHHNAPPLCWSTHVDHSDTGQGRGEGVRGLFRAGIGIFILFFTHTHTVTPTACHAHCMAHAHAQWDHPDLPFSRTPLLSETPTHPPTAA